ncbi:MAG: PIN/TRAM domain-containing protein [Candidatus Zipacnadales bacterium]
MAYPGIATLYVAAVTFVGVLIGNTLSDTLIRHIDLLREQQEGELFLFQLGLNVIGGLLGFLVGLYSFSKLVRLTGQIEGVPLLDKIAIVLGVFVGLGVAMLATVPFGALEGIGVPIRITAAILGVLLGVGFTMSAKQQIANVFPALGQSALARSDASVIPAGSKLFDTNIIIDGRISDICKTGFISGPIYVPGFVLQELQTIADSPLPLKRARGRRGLEILNQLKTEITPPVEVLAEYGEGDNPNDPVDLRLVRLAARFNAVIVTNDHNVNEIAKLHKVPVMNVNELSSALKPVYLPGEELTVTVVKEGKEPGQGVAYLDDGTMVVVEGAGQYVGQLVPVVVTSVLQTRAGKMIFTDLKGDESSPS